MATENDCLLLDASPLPWLLERNPAKTQKKAVAVLDEGEPRGQPPDGFSRRLASHRSAYRGVPNSVVYGEPVSRPRCTARNCALARSAWQRTLSLYAERLGVTVADLR
jgi:hypothetical protein